MTGHHIHAKDGDIGHVDDFVIDDESWAIRYLIVDTRNWFPGKKVLVSPQWIRRVSWSEAKIFVNLSREAIKHSPEITEEAIITRDYEMELYRHYNQPGYWAKEPPIKEQPLKKCVKTRNLESNSRWRIRRLRRSKQRQITPLRSNTERAEVRFRPSTLGFKTRRTVMS